MGSNSRMALVCAMTLWAATSGAQAEETKGRWRVEVALGSYASVDTIPSDSANVQTGFDEFGSLVNVFDPRPDEYGTNEASNADAPRLDLRVSYGLAAFENGEVVLAAGIGYFESEIQRVEFSYAFDTLDPDYEILVFEDPTRPPVLKLVPGCEGLPEEDRVPGINCRFFAGDIGGDQFNSQAYETWRTELVNPGTLEVIPVSVDVLARFRPTKRFNPYIGAGLGYNIVSFDATDRWNEIADQLDRSLVSYIERAPGSLSLRELREDPVDVKRPEVTASDTFFVQARGGAEWQWRPKTAFFVDVLFSWAQDEVTIEADGRQNFGRGVPSLLFRDPYSREASPYGGEAAYIAKGGIKKKIVDQDGNLLGVGPWPGEYYLQGGVLDLGGWSFSFGVRFTL